MSVQLSDIDIPERSHALLKSSAFAMLSTIRAKDDLISTNPVGFVWDGECIRISTLKSRLKYKNIENDPRVSFCVISTKNIMDYVEIRGLATLDDDPDCAFSRRQFMEGTGGMEPPEDMDPPGSERVIITIHPKQISSPTLYGGRFDKSNDWLDPEKK
jgi:PPOX class probable F420-dependent enzyme